MRLRAATHTDVPALAELVRECNHTHDRWAGAVPVPELEEEALEWDLRFARTDAWIQVAEEDDGRIVGAVAFAAGTRSRTNRELVAGLAHVSAVFVAPDCWRRGIARAMLQAAEDAMRATGFDRAQLFTLVGSPAEQFYTAAGWHQDGRREPYPPMGLEVVAYVKRL